MNTEEMILNTMQETNEPLKSGQIAEKLGIEKSEVDKIIKKLKKENKIISPKRCFYAINK